MFLALFKKDFQHLRLYLVIFACLVALQTLGSLRWVTDNYWLFKWLSGFSQVLIAAYYILAGIIIPLLVQDDPLVGVTAFYMTRPISRWVLLGEKIFFAAMFIAFGPAALESLGLWAQGFSTVNVLIAFPQFFYTKLVYILLLFILASLTRNIRQYLIWAIVIVTVITLAQGLIYQYRYELMFFKNPLLLDGRNYSLQWSINALVGIFTVFFIAFTLVHQFLRRNTLRTVKWIIAAMIFIAVVKHIWSWDFLQLNDLKLPLMDIGSRVEVSIDKSDFFVKESNSAWTKNNHYDKVSARETIEGLGPRQFAISRQIIKSRLLYPDGKVINGGHDWGAPKGVIYQYPTSYIDISKYVLALLDVFKKDTVVYPFPLSEDWVNLTWISFKNFAKYKDVPAQYSTKELFDVFEFRITGEMPLQVGREGQILSQTFRIYDVIEKKDGLLVVIEEKQGNFKASLANEGDINNFNKNRNQYYTAYNEAIYALRNRKSNEVFLPVVKRMEYKKESSLNLTMFCRYLGYRYIDAGKGYGALPKIDKQWLADAELVRIDAVRVGYFVKDVRHKGIRLGAKKKEYDVKNGLKIYAYPTGEVVEEWPDINNYKPSVVKRYYKSGALSSEWTYQGGERNGTGREYYEDGGIMYESEYKEGKLNGRVRKYAPDGKLISDRLFKNDVAVGEFK